MVMFTSLLSYGIVCCVAKPTRGARFTVLSHSPYWHPAPWCFFYIASLLPNVRLACAIVSSSSSHAIGIRIALPW